MVNCFFVHPAKVIGSQCTYYVAFAERNCCHVNSRGTGSCLYYCYCEVYVTNSYCDYHTVNPIIKVGNCQCSSGFMANSLGTECSLRKSAVRNYC